MSKVFREQPWSIICTIGKYTFVRMLQNFDKNSSCLDELRNALHFLSALSEDSRLLMLVIMWVLARTGMSTGEAGGIIRRCVLTSSFSEWGSGCTQLVMWTEIITEAWQSGSQVLLQFSGSRQTHNKIGLILPDIKLILNFQKRKKKCFGKQ